MDKVVNVVFAGLGGQGVLKVADILAEAAFNKGYDVRQSEVHGMSQRGGSVNSDIRFGPKIWSPMVPLAGADFLLILDPTQVDNNVHRLKEGGVQIDPSLFLGEDYDDIEDLEDDDDCPINRRNFNIAMLGALSAHLEFDDETWATAIKANLPAKAHAENLAVFAYGKEKAGE